jgi:hypothetical protein
MSADRLVPLRRGLLLLSVHHGYPHSVAEALLRQAVGAVYAGELPALDRDLAYMCDRGFFLRHVDHVGRSAVTSFRLSPAGVDLAEGVTADPAIHVERGR